MPSGPCLLPVLPIQPLPPAFVRPALVVCLLSRLKMSSVTISATFEVAPLQVWGWRQFEHTLAQEHHSAYRSEQNLCTQPGHQYPSQAVHCLTLVSACHP